MTKLKMYHLDKEAVDEVDVDLQWLEQKGECSSQALKAYITAIRENLRQWSAKTKTRSERAHSTQKPHPQKGTGRARQGSLAATQYKGGGRPHGPKPKFDQHVKINKKERRKAIAHLLKEKLEAGSISLVSSLDMEAPKTAHVAKLLTRMGSPRRVLFMSSLGDVQNGPSHKEEAFKKSVKNIQDASMCVAQHVNGYDLAVTRHVVLTQDVLKELEAWLGN